MPSTRRCAESSPKETMRLYTCFSQQCKGLDLQITAYAKHTHSAVCIAQPPFASAPLTLEMFRSPRPANIVSGSY